MIMEGDVQTHHLSEVRVVMVRFIKEGTEGALVGVHEVEAARVRGSLSE